MALFAADGSPYSARHSSQIWISTTVQNRNGVIRHLPQTGHVVPDDSVVRYVYQTQSDDDVVWIRVGGCL